jgi:hypothetical protein
MSVERQDVRFKLDDADKKGLDLLVEVDKDGGIADWCERVVVAEIRRRIHDAQRIAMLADRAGISGIRSAKSGKAGET